MEIPVLKTIDIIHMPEIMDDFIIGATAYIGEQNSKGVDYFYFEITTPKRLVKLLEEKTIVNCRNIFVVKEFNLKIIEDEIRKILQECIRPTWTEVVQAINRYLSWEYDNIQYTSIDEAKKIISDIEHEKG